MRTPRTPPVRAIRNVTGILIGKPRKMSAGIVKTTAAATDSPADPVVWTMLFSRIVVFPSFLRIVIAMTAIGIDADVVRPTFRPRQTEAAPKTIRRTDPSATARNVSSAGASEAGTQGWNAAEDVAAGSAMGPESTGPSTREKKPLGARDFLPGERLRKRERVPASRAPLPGQPADEPDLGLEALVGARIEVVQAACEPAEPRSLVLAEVAHERPTVLEERAFLVGAVPERPLERRQPLALLLRSALPVQKAIRERVRRVRRARRKPAGGNWNRRARADGLGKERVEAREGLEGIEKIEVVECRRLGLFLRGQGRRLEGDRRRTHGDDVRRRSLAGVGAGARRPREGRRGGSGSDGGRGRAWPAQEAWGRESR